MRDLQKLAQYAARRKRRRLFRGVLTAIAAVVVFCTTYALILPAITLEGQTTYCGFEAHEHSEGCYQLTCGKEEFIPHYHSEQCRDENGELICHQEETTIHVHSDKCKVALTCTLKEQEAHQHSEGCFETRSVLVCTQEEAPGHTHDDSCCQTEKVCGLEETQGHTHGEGCYAEDGSLVCTQVEAAPHTHDGQCFTRTLICTQEETQGHTHTEDCYQAQQVLICEKEEGEGHTHTDSCYGTFDDFRCGHPEGKEVHEHTASCYYLACDAHVHTEECYVKPQEEPTQVTEEEENLEEDEEEIVQEDEREIVEEDEEEIIQEDEEESEGEPSVRDLLLEIYTEEELQELLDAYPAYTLEDIWTLLNTPATGEEPIGTYNSENSESGVSFEGYITNVSVKKSENGVWKDTTMVNSGDKIQVKIEYHLPSAALENGNRIIYYQLPGEIVPNANQSGFVTDTVVKNGKEETFNVGTYTISTDGKITIVFDHDFVNDDNHFVGTVRFEGEASLASDEGSKTIDLPGNSKDIVVTPPIINDSGTDASVAKTRGELVDGKIQYTLTVTTAKGSPDPLSVYDTLNGGVYNESTVQIQKVVENGEPTTLNAQEFVECKEENGSKKMNITGLPKLENSTESYVITYSVTPNAPAANGAQSVNNYVWLSNNANASNSYEISKAKIAKSGNYQEDSGLIKWDITVNEGGGNIAGWTLNDVLPEGYTFVGSAEIKNQNYQSLGTQELSGREFTYTFPENATGTYYITYYSTAPAENGQSITNTAKLKDPQQKEYTAVATPMVHKRQQSMWKAAETNQSQKLSDTSRKNVWKANLTLAEAQFNTYGAFTYTDHILAPASPDGAQHYGIPADIDAAIQTSIKFTYYDKSSGTTPTGSAGDYFTYAISYTDASGAAVAGSDAHATDFTITFTPKQTVSDSIIGKNIEFQYPTVVTFENLQVGETVTSKNQGVFGTSNVTAEQSYTKTGRLEKGVVIDSNNYTSADWSTEYVSGKTITYRLTLRPELSENGDITLTDTLPKGVSFVEFTNWTLTRSDTNITWPYLYDQSGNTVLFDFSVPGGAHKPTIVDKTTKSSGETEIKIKIPGGYNLPEHTGENKTAPNILTLEYTVTLTDAIWSADDQYTVILKNTLAGMNASASHSTKVDRTPDVLTKEGYQLNTQGKRHDPNDETSIPTNTIRYFVIINPAAQDLDKDPDSKTITLTDELTCTYPATAFLPVNSVKLYTYSATAADHLGSLVDGSMYTVTCSNPNTAHPSFSITFQDEQALVLVYEYQIDDGDASIALSFSNKAKLGNYSSGKSEIQLISSSSAATVEKNNLCFYKVDSKDYSKLLDGAVFALSSYNSTTQAWEALGDIGTENGKLKIEAALPGVSGTEGYAQIKQDTLYCLEEITAPVGYKTGAPTYFALLDTMTKDNISIPNGVDRYKINALGKYGGPAYIPNDSNSIYVRKVWQDSKGNTVTPVTDQIELQLIQQTQQLKYKTVKVFWYSDYDGNHLGEGYVPNTTLYENVTPKTYLVAPGTEFTIKKVSINASNSGRIVYWMDNGTQSELDTSAPSVSFGKINEDCNIYFWAANRWVEVYDNDVEYTEASEMDSSSRVYPNNGTIKLPSTDESGNPSWEHRWTNLPSSGENNTTYYYRVVETTNPNGWSVSYSANNGGIQSGNITVINTVPYDDTPKTTLQLEKQWKRYDLTDPNTPKLVELPTDDSYQAVFKLYKREKRTTEQGTTEQGTQVGENITLTNPNWTWTSSQLPLVENGKNLEYYFEEVPVNGFYPADVKKSEDGATVTFTNVQIPKTSITVEKQWFNSQGEEADAPANAVISYALRRKLHGSVRSENDEVVKQGQLGYVDGMTAQWQATHSDLDLLDANLKPYDYYVVETAVDGYDTAYDYGAETADSLTSGTVTIKNTKTPSFELPETGGTGTGLYTLAGLTFTAGAVLGLMKKRRKGERD